MRYKIITSNKEGSFIIREDELEKLHRSLTNKNIAIFKEGWLNPSHFVALVPAKDRINEINEAKRLGRQVDEPSPFAKLMIENGKVKKLSPQKRTEAQEEAEK